MEKNIKSYADLKAARIKTNQIIDNAKIDFLKRYHTGTIAITRDLINNVLLSKLNLIKAQYDNPIIRSAEVAKKIQLSELNEEKSNLELQIESVLSCLTAKFNQKKRITKIVKAAKTVAGDDKYIAYVGGESGYQLIIDDIDDISKARLYLEALDKLNHENIKREEIEKQFNDKIKNIDYEKTNFDEELEELRAISKFTNCFKLSDLEPQLAYLLYGDENDYTEYECSLSQIKLICQELKKEFELDL